MVYANPRFSRTSWNNRELTPSAQDRIQDIGRIPIGMSNGETFEPQAQVDLFQLFRMNEFSFRWLFWPRSNSRGCGPNLLPVP